MGFYKNIEEFIDDVQIYGLWGISEKIKLDFKYSLEDKWDEINDLFLHPDISKQKRKLKEGGIISVFRLLPFPYHHYAVYIGDNKVIHFASKNGDFGDDITIHEAPFEEFLRGSKTFNILEFDDVRNNPRCYRGELSVDMTKNAFHGCIICIPLLLISENIKNFNYHLYSPEETVERAKSMIGQTGYNLLFNNCEHFALWCKIRIKESRQVGIILELINMSVSKYLQNVTTE